MKIYAQIDKTKLGAARPAIGSSSGSLTQPGGQKQRPHRLTRQNSTRHEAIRRVDSIADNEADRDLVWPKHTSLLGESVLDASKSNELGSAWPHYQLSLDWWAGQRQANVRGIVISK
jgi:hypothetical protein